jgi:superfamily I DNA/RNA helicase
LASIAVGDIVLPYSGNVVARYRELETRLTDMEGLAYDELLEHLFPAAEEWTVPIWRIINENPDKNTPEEIYTTLLTNITQPELPSDVDYLRVMSLHKSKGLNADNVIVTTCVEGLLPYRYDSLTPEDERIKLEEQRRLFYVAITRARQTLVLSSVLLIPRENVHSMRVQVRGGNQDYAGTITTRFIGELGPAAPEPIRGDDWDY